MASKVFEAKMYDDAVLSLYKRPDKALDVRYHNDGDCYHADKLFKDQAIELRDALIKIYPIEGV